jgi:NAD(P)H-nitrite reductase large subunit
MEHYVIVGYSAAGLGGAETIRKAARHDRVTVVSAEAYPSYSRVLLSHYLEDEVGEDGLYWRGRRVGEQLGLTERLGTRAVGLDCQARRLILADGEELAYTKLLLATGAQPQRSEAPGSSLQGVYTLRTLDEARVIKSAMAAGARRAVVVGGGLVALKTACALRARGLWVTVAVASPRILSRNLDGEGAALVQRHLEEHGLRFRLGVEVEAFLGDSGGRVRAAVLTDGATVPGELVVVGKGVRPAVELAVAGGLKVRRGILVGETMETSVSGVYAAGDVCETCDPVTGEYGIHALWPNAVAQGRVAGANMAGAARRYPGGPAMNSVVLAGLPVIAAGAVQGDGPGDEVFTDRSPADRIYKRLVLREGRLVGLALVGEIAAAGVLIGLLRTGAGVERLGARLLDDGLAYPDLYGAVNL